MTRRVASQQDILIRDPDPKKFGYIPRTRPGSGSRYGYRYRVALYRVPRVNPTRVPCKAPSIAAPGHHNAARLWKGQGTVWFEGGGGSPSLRGLQKLVNFWQANKIEYPILKYKLVFSTVSSPTSTSAIQFVRSVL
mgnify:CR=1 FL=1